MLAYQQTAVQPMKFVLIFVLSSLMACAVQAAGVTLCVSDRPAAPLTFPDHEGQAQYLARQAMRAAGVEPSFVVLPWRRCIESVRAGQVDGVLGVQAFHTYKDFVRFPLRNGLPDRAFSVGVDTWVMVTPSGSGVRWDGKALHGVTTPVSYPAGVNVVRQSLDDLNIRNVDSAKTALQLMQMLKAQRLQAVVMRESDAKGFLAQDEFKSLQILAPMFLVSDAYLVFSNGYAQAYPGLVAQAWEAIRRIRASREWVELAPALAK
jgi:polar amino acid transport system substrate-binding protein